MDPLMWPPMWSLSRTSMTAMGDATGMFGGDAVLVLALVLVLVAGSKREEEEGVGEEDARRAERSSREMRPKEAMVAIVAWEEASIAGMEHSAALEGMRKNRVTQS